MEKELIDRQIKVTFRGKAWGENCQEWVYFDCLFTDLEKIIQRFDIDSVIVKNHSYFGTHDGQEYGLICSECKDGILGYHSDAVKIRGSKVIKYE